MNPMNNNHEMNMIALQKQMNNMNLGFLQMKKPMKMNNMMANNNLMGMNNIMMNNPMGMNNMMNNNIMMNNPMGMNNMMNNNMMMNNPIGNNNMMMNNPMIMNNMMNNNMMMNNPMGMNNMNNNMMMNNPMGMNNMMNPMGINDFMYMNNNNNFIQNQNNNNMNKNKIKLPKKERKEKREIPPILLKNANIKIESITFQVQKELKPKGALSEKCRQSIFSELFSKRKSIIDERGKLKYLNENETQEVLHYKLDTKKNEFFNFGKKSLIQGLVFAYKNHYPMTITPDMIWLLILQGYSRFMDKYHELVREKYVNFEGQKTLHINRYGTEVGKATEDDWDGIIDECVEQIGDNIGKETVSNLQSDFTTTNAATLLASQASIMSAMKHYFKYEVLMGGCGVSSITLEGNLEDWEKIKSKLEYLSKFALKWWTKHLIPIIDKIIQTKKYFTKNKKINSDLIEFWKKMIRVKSEEYQPDMIDGWIIKFIPNLEGDKPKLYEILNEHCVPDEILSCPLKIIEDLSNGFKTEYECDIASGFYGMIQDKKTLCVKPVIGYAIVVLEKKTSPLSKEDKDYIIKNYFN